jgi:hypothetical protein
MELPTTAQHQFAFGPPPKLNEGRRMTNILALACMCMTIIGCTTLPFVLLMTANGWKSALSLEASHAQTPGSSDTTMRAPTPEERVALASVLPGIRIVALVVQDTDTKH